MQNILFRADSSSDIGTGHIMRDLVLAQEFKEANIFFATLDLSGNINHKIQEKNYKIITLKSNQLQELDRLIKELKINTLVIDHYKINETYEKQLKDQNPNLIVMVLDDTYEKHYCDILLNHNISADDKKYRDLVPPFCELRCGKEYTLLREEFYQERDLDYPKKAGITRILLCIGGTDHKNINISILKVLETFSNLEVKILTTTANRNIKSLQAYCLTKAWSTLHINSDHVAQLMRQSDLAIISPSLILNEVVFMQLPFIAIKTADNQDDIYNYLIKNTDPVIEEFNSTLLSTELSKFLL